MTYLELVNKILIRLRESQVTTITQNDYSTLIAEFVNDAKREVENAWNWESLYTQISVTTSSGTSEYTVTGSGRRFRVSSVNDDTNDAPLRNVSISWIDLQTQMGVTQTGNPGFYAFSGSDGTDTKVKFYPTPDATNTIKFNLYVPQVDLSAGTDVLTVDSDLVIQGALARAMVERGEDGGMTSSEQYSIFKSRLGDMIAQEANRSQDTCWVAD